MASVYRSVSSRIAAHLGQVMQWSSKARASPAGKLQSRYASAVSSGPAGQWSGFGTVLFQREIETNARPEGPEQGTGSLSVLLGLCRFAVSAQYPNCGAVLNAQARALANCVLGDHIHSEDRAAPPPMRATYIETVSPANSPGNLQVHRNILRSGKWPPRHPGHELMILKLTREDATELRKALEAAHVGILRELSGLAGCGYSPKGIDLCHRRSRLEQLLALIERRPEVQTLPQFAMAIPRAAIASFRPGSYKTKNPRQGMSRSFPIRALQAQAPGVLRDSPLQRVLGAVRKLC